MCKHNYTILKLRPIYIMGNFIWIIGDIQYRKFLFPFLQLKLFIMVSIKINANISSPIWMNNFLESFPINRCKLLICWSCSYIFLYFLLMWVCLETKFLYPSLAFCVIHLFNAATVSVTWVLSVTLLVSLTVDVEQWGESLPSLARHSTVLWDHRSVWQILQPRTAVHP